MINTQTQIDSLIDLAVLQRTELKQLVDSLPQLRDHLSSEIERNLEEIEPAIRSELEQFVAARALDTQAKTSAELSAKLDAMARNLESTTAAKYSVLMAERAQNTTLLAQAEARIAEAASALPGAVKGIVTDELARFPRAGEIDQLRKEFAEPRGLNPRGRWQAGETYNKLDLVSYNGDSYVSNTNGNREKPSRSSEAWTLSAARGNGGAGGGVTSLTDLVAVPANGELLIGNGSAFVNNTITGGTGVTVTNGPGTITIDASGAQEILTATVTNAESFAITRGQVVYLFGATGNRASVKLADNSNDAASSKTFGVVSEASIAAGANGLVTCVGVVDKLTLGSYTEGDVLYLGATPGSVTVTKPYAPNHLVYVGIVERANNGNGELYVRIQNGFELDEIHDVQITTPPLAGSLLMRDATTSLWKANRLTGTANQVTVTNADTSVTLSLPTAIANVNSVTAATTQNLTLAGGSTGASLVLGQGASGGVTLASVGSGPMTFTLTGAKATFGGTASNNSLRVSRITTNPSYIEIGATTDIPLLDFSAASGAGLRFVYNNTTELARLTNTGNLLIGTTTDGGQKLQVAGDIISNSTSGSNIIANDPTFNHPVIQLKEASVNKAAFETVSGDAYLSTQTAGKSLYLRSGNATTALTLASNQAATFAGAVNVALTGTSGTTDTALNLTTTQTAAGSGTKVRFGSTTYAALAEIHGGNVSGGQDGFLDFYVRSGGSAVKQLAIASTGAATFAGAVSAQSTLTVSQGSTFGGGGSEITGAGYLRAVSGYAKTDTSTRNIAAFSTNEAAGSSFKLLFSVTGNATLASRVFDLQTSNEGVSDTGILRLQNNGGTVSVGGAATFAGAVTVNGASGGLSNFITGNSSSGNYSFWDANSSPLASDGYSIFNLRAFSSLTGSKTQIFGIDVSKSGAGTDNAAKVFFNLHNGTNLSPFMSVSAARDTTFAGAVSVNSVNPSTGAGSGALQVAGGIYAGAASNLKTITLGYDVTNYTTPGTLSNYSATNGVYLNGNTAGFLMLSGDGSQYSSLRLDGGTTGTVTLKTANTTRLTVDGTTGTATFASTVIAPAATTAISSVRLPHGAAPTSPVNGDMWTTTAGLYVRINGVTVGPLS